MYRYNSKDYPDTAWEVNPGNVRAEHRYSGKDKGAVYTATDEKTARLEIGGDTSKHDLHTKDIEYDNMLDLSDPVVQKELGITDRMIDTPLDENPNAYEIPQAIGDKARELGFDGVIAPSSANAGGINVILFESIP